MTLEAAGSTHARANTGRKTLVRGWIMRNLTSGFAVAGGLLFVLSLLSFGLVVGAHVGLFSSQPFWVFWYIGVFTCGAAVVAMLGWGVCCGLGALRRQSPGGFATG